MIHCNGGGLWEIVLQEGEALRACGAHDNHDEHNNMTDMLTGTRSDLVFASSCIPREADFFDWTKWHERLQKKMW